MSNTENNPNTQKNEEKAPNSEKKLSLYFKPKTLQQLIQLKDSLILTGLPSTRLPDTHKIIDGIITYVNWLVTKYPEELSRLQSLSKGIIIESKRELKPEKIAENEPEEEIKLQEEITSIDSGRFLYKLNPETSMVLRNIKTTIKEDITEPILIRIIIEFALLESIDRYTIITHTFAGTLYNISPTIAIKLLTHPLDKITTNQLKEINKQDKDALRKVSWDAGVFAKLKKTIAKEGNITLALPTKIRGGRLLWIFGLKPKTYDNIIELTQSKAGQFNYATAYSGMSLLHGMLDKDIQSIPEAIIHINTLKNYLGKDLLEDISALMDISNKINNNPEI